MNKLKPHTSHKNLFILLSTTTLNNISLSPRERFHTTFSKSTFSNESKYYSLIIKARRHISYNITKHSLGFKSASYLEIKQL